MNNFSDSVKIDASLDLDISGDFERFLNDYGQNHPNLGQSLGILLILFAMMLNQGQAVDERDASDLRAAPLNDFLDKILTHGRLTNPHFLITRGLSYLNYLGQPLFAAPSLDLGCSDGATSKLLFDHKFDYGVDILADFEADNRRNEMHDQFLVGGADAIPLPDQSVGSVVVNNTLYHAADRASAFREIYRVLRPGGTLAFDDVSPEFFSDDSRPFVSFMKLLGGGDLAADFMKKRNEVYMAGRRMNPYDAFTAKAYESYLPQFGFRDVKASYFTSLGLNRFAYGTHDIEYMLRGYVNPRTEAYRKWALGPLLARLLADRVVSAQEGGAYLFVTARK